jgi:hypothetical protein
VGIVADEFWDDKGIQGCINAQCVQLYKRDKKMLKKYMQNKTDKQKEQARIHLRGVLELSKQDYKW